MSSCLFKERFLRMWTLIAKESLENILTLRFVVGFLACNLLFGISTYVLVQDYSGELASAAAAVAESESEIDGWTVLSKIKPKIYQMPSSLTVFGSSAGPRWGARFVISHANIPVFAEDRELGSDLLAFYSGLDFPTVIQIFISMLAILFTFDAVSGEKERGSLRMILANGVGRARLPAAKLIGALMALAPIILSGFVVSLLVFLAAGSVALGVDDWLRLGIILLLTLLYAALFVAVGLLISSLTHRSAVSLVFGMIVWVVWILILPTSIGFFSQQTGDEEDFNELNANLQELRLEYGGKELQIFRPIAGDIGGDYMYIGIRSGLSEGDLLCRVIGKNAIREIREAMPRIIAVNRELAARRFELENDYLRRRLGKLDFTRNLQRLSPSMVLAQAIGAVAKTDTNSHLHFIEEARRYREEILNYVEGKGGHRSARWFTDEPDRTDYEDFVDRMETMTAAEKLDYYRTLISSDEGRARLSNIFSSLEGDPRRRLNLSDMPKFKANQPSLEDSLSASAPDLLLLVAYFAVAFGLALVFFLYYDVR